MRTLPPLLAIAFSSACLSDGETVATCDSGNGAATGDSDRTDTGGSFNNPSPGLDLSPRITQCPVWSGIPDTFATTGSFQGTYSDAAGYAYSTEIHTTAWWRLDGNPTATTAGGQEIFGGHLLTTDSQGAAIQIVRSGTRTFDCDEQGYWLVSDESHVGAVNTDGTQTTSPVGNLVDCSDSPLLLIPRELAAGTAWSARCAGGLVFANSPEPDWDCSYEFAVAETIEYSTPAGTWEAAHVKIVSSSDEELCQGLLARVSFVGANDGFWLGRGIGLIAMTEDASIALLRTAAR